MTSHELAQKLLALPDLRLKVKVKENDEYGSYYWYSSSVSEPTVYSLTLLDGKELTPFVELAIG